MKPSDLGPILHTDHSLTLTERGQNSLGATRSVFTRHRQLQSQVIREDQHDNNQRLMDPATAALMILSKIDPTTADDHARQRELCSLLGRQLETIHNQPYSMRLLDNPTLLKIAGRVIYQANQLSDPYTAILLAEYVTDHERVFGPDHPDTLTSRNNLACAYQTAGDLGRAIPLYQQTLTDRERILGPDHPQTLTSRNNLAYAYQTADLGRAIRLYQQTLTDRERILGPDHPQTLTLRNNLAYAYWNDGRRPEALREFTKAATTAEQLFGPAHFVTRRLVENRDVARSLLADDQAP